MNFCVKLLSIFLVLVMLGSTVVSCAFQPNSNPSTQGSTTTNNGITVLPPNNDDNKDDINNENGGNVEVIPPVEAPDVQISAPVTPDADNKVPEGGVNMSNESANATVPGGVQLEEGTTELSLTVNGLEQSEADLELLENEISTSFDVHMAGVAEGNLVPMIITLTEATAKGLNSTSIRLYHVENGETLEMTRIANNEEFTSHNQFKYDPATGDVTLYIASFSEIAVVANTVNAWKGAVDHSWYDANATTLYIANAEQLWSFSQIVGAMAKDENGEFILSEIDEESGETVGVSDSFSGKTVILLADINLGDKESENNPDIIFYPIGYSSSDGLYEKTGVAVTTGFYNFCGTFDGNGHTIANFYHNTWEMKGDNNYYDAALQYYRDGMGLFGRVYGGTVKNLTVSNFSSDGEYTTTGVIAAYADGATFENISVFNCNPRVYNIGNGGIVGCVGWYAKEAGLTTEFTNITVDNSNKISALWGSYDVACGGIVGQYYPTSGQTSAGTLVNAGLHFDNCHISAQMDVYNDVCANYQYYAYRYTGMIIGSVRENVTGDDGRSYPKMDGITAKDCTVHFGTWNDYYYCEIIDNTTASYTHDYQMSRLTEIKAIDGTTITYLDGTIGTVPASGRANYVIVDYSKGHGTENATCYHFKDGAVWTHDMGGIQEGIDENGDGQDDLKEDKQHIYLEFNNLVTGYGWGVTTKAVGDLAGVTILDKETGDSVVKFESLDKPLTNNRVYKLSDIFAYITECGFDVVNGALAVGVTKVNATDTVSANIVYDRENWANSTISFTGKGTVQITIQDYYFCIPTTITVDITERQPEEKFDIVMNNGDFLHRVGNIGTVALDKLFIAKDGVSIGTVSVLVEAVNGSNANGTYSNNAIQFNGTGVVKVTITDNDYCIPTELYLEVVDATNVTTATNATSGNIVLLNDIGSGFTVSGEYTFYGNGFTLNYTGDGRYLNNGLKQGLVTVSENGTLDNLRIKASIYPTAFMYYGSTQLGDYVQQSSNPREVDGDKTRYYYQLSAVVAKGSATISNCYIYGARTNIFVDTGNVTIKDSVLECGTVANIQIQSTNKYTVTLDNVTTIQYRVNATIGDTSKVMLGTGVLVGPDTTSNPNIVLNGEFKQYNWVNEDDKNAITDLIPQLLIAGALDATAYNHTVNGKTASNLGIIYMNTEDATVTNNTGLPYVLSKVTMKYNNNSIDGQVCSLQNATESQIYSDYDNADRSTVNGDYIPTFEFDLGTQTDSKDSDSDNRYLYGDKNGIFALYQDGNDPIALNIDQLATIYKYTGIPYTVTAKCLNANGNELAKNNGVVTLDAMGSYTLVFTVEDNIFYNANGETITKSVTRTYTVSLTLDVKAADIKDATVSISKTSLDGTYTTVNLTDYKLRINFLDCISITDYDNKGNGTTVSLSSNIASATLTPASVNVFTTAFTVTVTYTDGRVLTVNFSKISGSSPGTKTAVVNTSGGLYFITEGALNNKPTASSDQNKCTITSVSFKGNSGSTITNDTDVTVTWALGSSSGCFAEGTLITLADGTQKRIEDITYADELLAWDFHTGTYTTTVPSLIESHEADEFRVINLKFADGTVARVIVDHGFFNVEENNFVFIDEQNVDSYVGQNFVKVGANGTYESVELVGYEITVEQVRYYSIQTAIYNNCIAENMFTLPAPPEMLDNDEWFDYFEIGEGMKYDEEKMQADIAKYGLYTYEDFAEYVTYEQFIAFNGPYLKVLVGRGVLTFEQILELIATYVA